MLGRTGTRGSRSATRFTLLARGAVALVALAGVLATSSPIAWADRVVAVAPLSTLGTEDTSESTKQLTTAIEVAAAALPGTTVIGATAVSAAIKAAKKPQLKACEGQAECLAELGKLVGANVVIAGEVGGLGESKIVYLRATDVAAAQELRSTTLAVGAAATGDDGGPDGAVVRLLAPERYRGTLQLAIDVTGATVFVNGTRATLGAQGVLTLPVGTQAVRVTHPEYHDFVRFIPVTYGKTTAVTVGMQQYPIVQRDLQGKPLNRDTIVYVDPPVWRRWYVWGGVTVGVAILAGVAAGLAASRLPAADACTRIGGNPC